MSNKLAFILLIVFFQSTQASPNEGSLSVWVNEAIVSTYTYSYKNYLEEQKKIAKYFTANAWMAYSKALQASGLPESVQKNLYYVRAVATQPPVVTSIDSTHWRADMNLLVVYQNPQYQQRQNLKVIINFMKAPSGQGVRGYSMSNLQAILIKPSCKCVIEEEISQDSAK